MPIVADAAVKIGADFSTFGRELEQGVGRPVQSLGQRIRGALSPQTLATAGVIGATAAFGALTAGLVGAAKSLMDIERLNAQTNAAIRSTGGAANVTGAQIEEMAESMEVLTTIERETVQEAANMLLTFTNVRNEVGAGRDIFNQATEAAANMSVALGTDMTSAAMMVGKALNDPVRGMTAMTRAGIQFTDQQKEMIEAMVESGDLLGAQTIILRELERQFGGSAEAFADTTAGRIQRFQNDVGNMFESIIVGAVKVADFMGETAEAVGNGFAGIGDILSTEVVLWGDDVGAAVDDVKQRLETLPPSAHSSAFATAAEFTAGLNEGGPGIRTEAANVASMLPEELAAKIEEVRAAGRSAAINYAAGLLDAQNDPLAAMEALLLAQRTALTRAEEVARLEGQLTSKELGKGLLDPRDEVRAAAEALELIIRDRLETLGVDSYGWGGTLGSEFARGLDSAQPAVRAAANRTTFLVRGIVGIQSEPTDPSSGLRGITKWGGNIATTLAEGMLGKLGVIQSAAGMLSGALTPSFAQTTFPGGGSPSGGGGVTYQLVVNGVPRAFNSRTDFMNALDDLGSFGDGRLG